MAGYWYKHIFGEVKRLAPLMHISEEDYRGILSREALRTDGTLKELTQKEYLQIRYKLEADARACGSVLAKPLSTSDVVDTQSQTKAESMAARHRLWHGDKMLNKVKSLCHQDPAFAGLEGNAFYWAIDSLLTTHGKYRKALNLHTYPELVLVIGQMQAILKNDLKAYHRA